MSTITVTLVSVTTTRDKYGDETYTEARQDYDGVRFAPRSSQERVDPRSPAVITAAALYRRGGDFPVDRADRIEITGQSEFIDGSWQVEGDPGYWGRGIEVAIKRASS